MATTEIMAITTTITITVPEPGSTHVEEAPVSAGAFSVLRNIRSRAGRRTQSSIMRARLARKPVRAA